MRAPETPLQPSLATQPIMQKCTNKCVGGTILNQAHIVYLLKCLCGALVGACFIEQCHQYFCRALIMSNDVHASLAIANGVNNNAICKLVCAHIFERANTFFITCSLICSFFTNCFMPSQS